MKPIKKILAPTDFSPTSNNALQYAAGLAAETNAQLFIFHTYRIPEVTDAAYPIGGMYPDGMVDANDIKKEVNEEMNKVVEDYVKDKNIKYEILISAGFTEENILSAIKEKDIDLNVMGTRGANALQELFGSTTSHIISHTEVPVLVIPKTARFEKIDNIVLASDYKKSYKPGTYEILLSMADLFHASIDVLHVRPEKEKMTTDELEAGDGLDRILKKTHHTFHFQAEKEDVNDAIEKFLKKHDKSMLAMVPRKHSLIDRLIHGSKTQHMIFHTEKPLLVMKD